MTHLELAQVALHLQTLLIKLDLDQTNGWVESVSLESNKFEIKVGFEVPDVICQVEDVIKPYIESLNDSSVSYKLTSVEGEEYENKSECWELESGFIIISGQNE